MAKIHTITANGLPFSARTGDVILDCAMLHGVEFPHDCRAGRCGSCVARVISGVALGGKASRQGSIHACQARALSNLELEFDIQPPVQSINGRVVSLTERAHDVIEVGLKLLTPLEYRPGQYCQFKFRGYPLRSFSPTLPADGSTTGDDITLHVKKVRGGRVSNALGKDIQVGHKLRVEGPFGAAYYRTDSEKRLVLVASGTGFAPILSILMAALDDPTVKPIVLIVGARNLRSLYMATTLTQMNRRPNVELVVTTRERSPYEIIRHGSPIDHLPTLEMTDGIYAAGSPAMITELAKKAGEAGAAFYADPFDASPPPQASWFSSKISWPGRRVSSA